MPHKVKIEKGSVQETLMLPLYAKAWCRRHYPDIFGDCDAGRIIGMIDWDDATFRRKEGSPALKIAAVAAGTRQYAIACELKETTRPATPKPSSSTWDAGSTRQDARQTRDNAAF